MRYVGQSYELQVPLADGSGATELIEGALARFHAVHERVYGHATRMAPVEFVSLRTIHSHVPQTLLSVEAPPSDDSPATQSGCRPCCFDVRHGFEPTPVYDRMLLSEGIAIEGPAILEQSDTTTVLYPGHRVVVDGTGILIITAVKSPHLGVPDRRL
jgi:N-methylhydantoinase A